MGEMFGLSYVNDSFRLTIRIRSSMCRQVFELGIFQFLQFEHFVPFIGPPDT